MPLNIQPKFLRAIQEGEGYRLGSNRLQKYDLRILSATNKPLSQEVQSNRFREDLFFRLFSVEIHLPPLRERREDIAPLAFTFLDEVCQRFNKQVAGFASEVINLFEDYAWPGNVRQLRREIERMVALTPINQQITLDKCSRDLMPLAVVRAPQSGSLLDLSLPAQVQNLEIELIRKALKHARGNRTQAADLLGITRQGLHKKINRYGLSTEF